MKNEFDSNLKRFTDFPQISFIVSSNELPFTFVCFSKSHCKYVSNFLRDFFKCKSVRIRGDPNEATC